MEWHLNYNPAPSPVKISHTDKILLIGSCFAENIGKKLLENKFNCLVNPNGILFNPAAISTALRSYILNELKVKAENNNGLNFSFEHHGSFSKSNNLEFIEGILNTRKHAHQILKDTKFLIITFGSAYCYRYIKSNQIVANCHKLPQAEFRKELLSVENIVSDYKFLFEELKAFNPNLNIILTVSPVKYLRDGLIENNLSKAILIQSVHQLTSSTTLRLPNGYFPAYELVNDDLRDYRFYKEDMAHPNEQAINYVWEKFSDCYFANETKQLNQKINEINKAVLHKPLFAGSKGHSDFTENYLNKCKSLSKEFPECDFSKEINIFSSNG